MITEQELMLEMIQKLQDRVLELESSVAYADSVVDEYEVEDIVSRVLSGDDVANDTPDASLSRVLDYAADRMTDKTTTVGLLALLREGARYVA